MQNFRSLLNASRPLAKRSLTAGRQLTALKHAQFGGMMGMGGSMEKQPIAYPMTGDDKIRLWEMEDRVGILLTLEDKPGILTLALQILTYNSINMTSIQSKPPKLVRGKRLMNFNIDFHGSFEQENVANAL